MDNLNKHLRIYICTKQVDNFSFILFHEQYRVTATHVADILNWVLSIRGKCI